MNKTDTVPQFASLGRRFGAFFIDQVVLGFISLLAAIVVYTSQIDQIRLLGQSFSKFIVDNQNVSNAQLNTNLDTLLVSSEVQSALGALVVPTAIWLVTNLLVAAIYYIGLTARRGQTLGKKLCKIIVQDEIGKVPRLTASIERYFLFVGLSGFSGILTIAELLVYRTLEIPNTLLSTVHSVLDLVIFVLFLINVMLILTRADRRGYHDISAGTYVTKLASDK